VKGPYTMVLLDDEGCELSNTEHDNFKLARLAISEKCREPSKNGYAYGDAVRAKVFDATGACVHDVPLRFPHADSRARQGEGDDFEGVPS
jgi:hypothetical protein